MKCINRQPYLSSFSCAPQSSQFSMIEISDVVGITLPSVILFDKQKKIQKTYSMPFLIINQLSIMTKMIPLSTHNIYLYTYTYKLQSLIQASQCSQFKLNHNSSQLVNLGKCVAKYKLLNYHTSLDATMHMLYTV